jgi:hypothetical protein
MFNSIEMRKLIIVCALQLVSFVVQLRIHGSQLLVPLFKTLAIDMFGNT